MEYECWSFPPELRTPQHARQRLGPLLEMWGLSPDDQQSTLLVMNELVTNAVEHAQTPLQLDVTLTGNALQVEVRDESTAAPRLHEIDPKSCRGHGLRVVAGLSSSWNWNPSGRGKSVRATLPLTSGRTA
jgi:two-component sensor histidine kinase